MRPLLTAMHRYDKSFSTHDLTENLDEEVAPGLCWNNREDLALDSIRKLKAIASETRADIWPNHDISFWHTLQHGPAWRD